MHYAEEPLRNICNWSDATMTTFDAASPSHLDMTDSSSQGPDMMKTTTDTMPTAGGHMMSANDPDNPQNWPLHKKIYASAVAFAFAWVV